MQDNESPQPRRLSGKLLTIGVLLIIAAVVVGVAGVHKSRQDKVLSGQSSNEGSASTSTPSSNSQAPATLNPVSPETSGSNSTASRTPSANGNSVTNEPMPKETVSVKNVTSPAYRGSDATLTASTTANSDCTIVVHYKSGPSHAQGLYEHSADSSGSISWTWVVGTNTTPGSWPIDVSCTNNGQSANASTSFEVQ